MSEETTQQNTVNDTDTSDIVTEGSVRHNKALLNELKQAQAALAKYETEKAERETAAAKKAGDYEGLLKKEQEKVAKLASEKQAEVDAREARINQLMTDNALKDMVGAYDVKPSLRPALMSHLRGQLTVTAEGVVFDGKSPADFAKAFFASEDGRDFLKTVVNSGGGATGNTGSTPSTPDKWNFTTYAEMKKDDPTLAAAYAKKHGKPF